MVFHFQLVKVLLKIEQIKQSKRDILLPQPIGPNRTYSNNQCCPSFAPGRIKDNGKKHIQPLDELPGRIEIKLELAVK